MRSSSALSERRGASVGGSRLGAREVRKSVTNRRVGPRAVSSPGGAGATSAALIFAAGVPNCRVNERDGRSNVEAARACLRVRDRAGFRGACDEDVCEVRARAAFISRCTSRAQRAPPFASPHFKP